MRPSENHLTGLLERAAAGDPVANENLFAEIYPTLKKLARSQLAGHRRGTICTTELANEASLRLFGADKLGQIENRQHLAATMARAMRHILVDHARKRRSQKRGGDWARVDLDDAQLSADSISDQVLALDDAMQKLHSLDERGHHVVELKFYGGYAIDEIAAILEVSPGTVKNAWRKARAYLYAEMGSIE